MPVTTSEKNKLVQPKKADETTVPESEAGFSPQLPQTIRHWNLKLGLPAGSRILRKEIRAGRLKALRLRPGPNARLLLLESEVTTWIRDFASKWALVSR